jgi:hypothetical protein
MSKLLMIVTIGLALFAAGTTFGQTPASVQSIPAGVPVPVQDGGKVLTLAPANANSGPVFAFEAFGVLETKDLDRGKGGVGIGAVLNLTDYLGVEGEAYSFGTGGVLIDRVGASLRYNIVTGSKSHPYLFGGGWYNLENTDAYGFHAGVGISHQFAKFLTPFADVRFSKPLNGPDTATACIARAGLSFGF